MLVSPPPAVISEKLTYKLEQAFIGMGNLLLEYLSGLRVADLQDQAAAASSTDDFNCAKALRRYEKP